MSAWYWIRCKEVQPGYYMLLLSGNSSSISTDKFTLISHWLVTCGIISLFVFTFFDNIFERERERLLDRQTGVWIYNYVCLQAQWIYTVFVLVQDLPIWVRAKVLSLIKKTKSYIKTSQFFSVAVMLNPLSL